MQRAELWKLLEELIQREGVSLFDFDLPSGGGGVLRVFIDIPKDASSEENAKGVQHSHCAAVSQRIINHPRVEEILPGRTTLEVSSPGINRKLSRTEHFQGAVGERVRVTYRLPETGKTTVTGLLQSFDGQILDIEAEGKKGDPLQKISVPFRDVEVARIDFLF